MRNKMKEVMVETLSVVTMCMLITIMVDLTKNVETVYTGVLTEVPAKVVGTEYLPPGFELLG